MGLKIAADQEESAIKNRLKITTDQEEIEKVRLNARNKCEKEFNNAVLNQQLFDYYN